MVELTGLHEVKVILILRGETQGIEAEVTRDVRILDLVNVLGVIVPARDTETFADTDSEEENLPELREDGLNSLETAERGDSSDTVEKRMVFLSDQLQKERNLERENVRLVLMILFWHVGDFVKVLAFEYFTYPTDGGKHGNTSVSNLSLAVTLGLGDGEGRGVSELDRIEETQGGGDSGEGKHVILTAGALGGGGLQMEEE